MRTDPPYQTKRHWCQREQTMLDPMHLFADQMQISPAEQVVCFCDRTGEGILDGHERDIGFADYYCVDRGSERSVSIEMNLARKWREVTPRRRVTIRGFHSLIRDD